MATVIQSWQENNDDASRASGEAAFRWQFV